MRTYPCIATLTVVMTSEWRANEMVGMCLAPKSRDLSAKPAKTFFLSA